MKTVVVLQPGYLPWLGFFDQMLRADVFVYYDDVQFDKHGWRNRNRIKYPHGAHWLTVPVLHSGKDKPLILDVDIDRRTPWPRKHIGSIKSFYSKALYLDQYLPELEELLSRDWQKLVDLDISVTELIRKWLGIETPVICSSKLGISGARSERLVSICKHLGADRYLSGNAAKDYLDTSLFEHEGIRVEWHEYQHPTYPQLHGGFVPYLSILDLILNVGAEEAHALLVQGASAGKR